MTDFDWGRDNGNVVLRAYGSIAVYENPHGDVVVRQERDSLEEDDHWVAIPVQDAELIADAIIDRAKESRAAAAAEQGRPAQASLALPAPSNGSQPLNGARRSEKGGQHG